jgi:DNA repair exonuclease SbcCD ATPase subunit
MAEGTEKNTANTFDPKQYADPIGPIRTSKLSEDFLKKVEKTDSKLDSHIRDLTRLGENNEAAREKAIELTRLRERLNDATAHHNDHRTYKIGQLDANTALTKAHEEAASNAKEAKSQISKLKWQNRGAKLGSIVKSKYFIIPVAITGAITAAAMFSSKRAKQERADEVANRRQDTEALRQDVAVLKAAEAAQGGQPTLMGEQLREGDHAARVRAGRSNGAEPVINPTNPPVDLNYQVVR